MSQNPKEDGSNALLINIINNYLEVDRLLKERDKLLIDFKPFVKSLGLKDFLMWKKIGIDKAAYYRRMKKPSLWTLEELNSLKDIVEKLS